MIGKEELPKKSKMKTENPEGTNPKKSVDDQSQPTDQSADQVADEVQGNQETATTTPSNSDETEPQPPTPNEKAKKKSSACIIL